MLNSISELNQPLTLFQNQDVTLEYSIKSNLKMNVAADLSTFVSVKWKLVALSDPDTLIVDKSGTIVEESSKVTVILAVADLSVLDPSIEYQAILERVDTGNRYPLTGWSPVTILKGPPS
jgi:hypothetical protein